MIRSIYYSLLFVAAVVLVVIGLNQWDASKDPGGVIPVVAHEHVEGGIGIYEVDAHEYVVARFFLGGTAIVHHEGCPCKQTERMKP